MPILEMPAMTLEMLEKKECPPVKATRQSYITELTKEQLYAVESYKERYHKIALGEGGCDERLAEAAVKAIAGDSATVIWGDTPSDAFKRAREVEPELKTPYNTSSIDLLVTHVEYAFLINECGLELPAKTEFAFWALETLFTNCPWFCLGDKVVAASRTQPYRAPKKFQGENNE